MAAAPDRTAKATRLRLRCAVYTRKSSEEGLDQAFNSLDAQREACEAYIASQRHEGWMLLKDHYDDGGFSGGTMERPALRRLLSDMAAGRIDIVVVYKVDRLTRALGDFARIVELFDRHKASFVSVTQAFNTTSSMGRLTLNVLLSFAQFEREVTGERIRDKIAASKKKGIWMGGLPALGYDVHDRKLVVNVAEAATVRTTFGRYVELRSVRDLKGELDAAGMVSKRRVAADGSAYGGQRFSPGALYALLQNRLYLGEIVHKGLVYPGEHPAIVDRTLFDAVQSTLAGNRIARVAQHGHEPALLTGLLFDAEGERLTPSHALKTSLAGKTNHALKKSVRYCYYISRHLFAGPKSEARGLRLPAIGIEMAVQNRMLALLADPAALVAIMGDSDDQTTIIAAAIEKAKDWPALATADKRIVLAACFSRIVVQSDRIEMTLRPGRLVAWIMGGLAACSKSSGNDSGCSNDGTSASAESDDDRSITITAPVRLRLRGQEMRLVFGDDQTPPPGHAALVRLLARAHAIKRRLFDEGSTVDELAQAEDLMPSYVTRLVRLSFLAPDITGAILAGRHDPNLTVTRLMADTRFPLDWAQQRKMLTPA